MYLMKLIDKIHTVSDLRVALFHQQGYPVFYSVGQRAVGLCENAGADTSTSLIVKIVEMQYHVKEYMYYLQEIKFRIL